MDRLHATQVTVPAASGGISTLSQQWSMEDAYLLYVEVVIPYGHSGLTGIRLSRLGTPILPYSTGDYIVADNEKLTVQFNGEITKYGVDVDAYNLDIYDHTFYLRALVKDIAPQSQIAAPVQPTIPNVLISTIP